MSEGQASVRGNEWRGFHHIAIFIPDIDRSVRFYVDVLGMSASDIVSSSRQGGARNCFVYVDARQAGSGMGIHLFEKTDLQAEPDPIGTWEQTPVVGTIHHAALALSGQQAGITLRGRLKDAGVWVSEVIDFGTTESLLFSDNNGLLLEATWPKPEPELSSNQEGATR